MRSTSCESSRRRAIPLLVRAAMGAMALALPLVSSPARADIVNSGGLERKDVKVTKVEGDELYYTTAAGRDSHNKIDDKLRINISDEASLNTAEDAFAAAKWADAADAYQKTVRSTAKPWLKDYAAARLLKAADKSGRFDSAVAAWLVMVDKDPKSAAEKKPTMPADPKSTYVATAAAAVESAGNSTKDSAKATTLLAYALELYRANGNDKKVTDLANSLGRATSNAGGGGGSDAVGAVAASKLSLAGVDLDKKDFKSALAKLNDVREVVTDPAQQSEWLWVNAEAQAGMAGELKDPTALKTLALEYMKVPAHFPQSKQTGKALLRVAAIYEKLGDNVSALNLYQQVARDFGDQAAGAEAKKSVQRLKTPGGAPQATGTR